MSVFDKVTSFLMRSKSAPYIVMIVLIAAGWAANHKTQMVQILPPLTTSNGTDVAEAKVFLKMLQRLGPEATELLHKERRIANLIRITLDETSTAKPSEFRAKLRQYLQEMIAVRRARAGIIAALKQASFSSNLVSAVQNDAIDYLKHEAERTEYWISAATNVQLREDLGRQTDFKELPDLSKRLENFLAQPFRDPLDEQVVDLNQEFRGDLYAE